jgi:hypothetical protein
MDWIGLELFVEPEAEEKMPACLTKAIKKGDAEPV